jgi:NAD(P)-dependent dehydrogenase (short-subunit alcohol dehydrogenase family)
MKRGIGIALDQDTTIKLESGPRSRGEIAVKEAAGRRAIITGAAQGLGRAIALRLAETGAKLSLWDIREDGLRDSASRCEAQGATVTHHRIDVSVENEIAAGVDTFVAAWGPPNILVNNAGIFPRASALDIDLSLWNKVIAVNLGSTFLCSRACARHMLAAGGGVIINMASGRAFEGAVLGAHYAASKGAIVNLTKSLALEWAPTIRVNCVVPGLSDTAQPREGMTEVQIQDAAKTIPLRRIGRPEDTASLIAFLVSDEADYITGQSIATNGGAVMLP